jgi:hypothetical protein
MQARSEGATPAPPRRAATPLGAAEEDELAGNREERKLETCARYGDEIHRDLGREGRVGGGLFFTAHERLGASVRSGGGGADGQTREGGRIAAVRVLYVPLFSPLRTF